MENEFRIRPYMKRELALMYAIHKNIKKTSAVTALYREMKRCEPLMSELYKTGYRAKNRSFTKRQVELIVQYLCEP